MGGASENVRTGSVVGRYVGPRGDELAVAVRLPISVWSALSRGLYDIFYGSEHNVIPDDDAPIDARIELFLDLAVAEWEAAAAGPATDGDADDGVPF